MTTEAERIRIVNAALEREMRRGTRDARAVMNATRVNAAKRAASPAGLLALFPALKGKT